MVPAMTGSRPWPERDGADDTATEVFPRIEPGAARTVGYALDPASATVEQPRVDDHTGDDAGASDRKSVV